MLRRDPAQAWVSPRRGPSATRAPRCARGGWKDGRMDGCNNLVYEDLGRVVVRVCASAVLLKGRMAQMQRTHFAAARVTREAPLPVCFYNHYFFCLLKK